MLSCAGVTDQLQQLMMQQQQVVQQTVQQALQQEVPRLLAANARAHYTTTTAATVVGERIHGLATTVRFAAIVAGADAGVSAEVRDAMSTHRFEVAARQEEEDVQTAVTSLLTTLSRLGGATLRVYDTHNQSPLRMPLARIDISLTARTEQGLTWTNLVMPLELKATFTSGPAYCEAVSQIHSRARYMFKEQPERVFIVAAVADRESVEFWRFDRATLDDPEPTKITRSGLHPLGPTVNEEGWVLFILRM